MRLRPPHFDPFAELLKYGELLVRSYFVVYALLASAALGGVVGTALREVLR